MNRILVALDVSTRGTRRSRWPITLRGAVGGFKIGSQLFTAAGPDDRARRWSTAATASFSI